MLYFLHPKRVLFLNPLVFNREIYKGRKIFGITAYKRDGNLVVQK